MKPINSTPKILFCFFLGCLGFSANAQIVNIPDSNFKNALLTHNPVIDTNADGEIQQSEAQAITILDVHGQAIQDLTGIGAFINLTDLYCSNNQLTTLDLSQNTLLKYLYCGNNQLTSLDVSQCTGLLDLYCSSNNLTTLNLVQNTKLRDLIINNNQLISLDLSQNMELDELICISNQLISLNLPQTVYLHAVDCADNQLTSLDVSHNTNLQILTVAHNNMTSMDLTQNTELLTFAGQNNDFTFLDIRNGKNLDLLLFRGEDNPNLECIFVDDASYSENHPDWYRDPASTYVETQTQCDALASLEKTFFHSILVYPNPVDKGFYISNPQNIQIDNVLVLDVLGNRVKSFSSGKSFYDLSGLQSGLYFVEISNKERSLARKIMKK